MKGRFFGFLPLPTVALGLALGLASCGGGGSGVAVFTGDCQSGQGICVTSCNLGCGPNGCGITDIAVNQPLVFTFNQPLDPNSVNASTFKMTTPTGNEPVGIYIVQQNNLFFVPDVKTIGNEAFFGFADRETYTLTIPSRTDALETIRSSTGDPVTKTFSCTLRVTRGIVDFDNKAPQASLILPNSTENVKRDSMIIIEFSEIVDTRALVQSNPRAGIRFRVAKKDKTGTCGATDFDLQGFWSVSLNKSTQRTQVLFRPSGLIPGNACVRVTINNPPKGVLIDSVRDLSGKRAVPSTFEFRTEPAATEPFAIKEDFSDPGTNRDPIRDGGKWTQGAAETLGVGGSGVLGDFSVANAKQYSSGVKVLPKVKPEDPDVLEVDASKIVVPKYLTLSGVEEVVTDGRLDFLSFEVERSATVRFVGTVPPSIRATGRITVNGTLDVSGKAPPEHKAVSSKSPPKGQAGTAGGPGGGKGGQGGDLPFLSSTGIGGIDGRAGETVQLPTGHPLSSAISATGGPGGPANPQPTSSVKKLADYEKLVIFSAYSAQISQQVAAGGGGGAFTTAGTAGRTYDSKSGFAGKPVAGDYGKPSGISKAVSIASLLTSTKSSAFLFGIGGAGGGGGGLCPMGAIKGLTVSFSSGAGGAGGGGFVLLKSGGDVVVPSSGRILARGGAGYEYQIDASTPMAAAAPGGGSGGSVLIQTGGSADLLGLVSVLGGKGGELNATKNYSMQPRSQGGTGGQGFIRVEGVVAPNFKSFANFEPAATAANAGKLKSVDLDKHSMLFTNWYRTGLLFPPTYSAYEIKAKIGSKVVTYSDDPKRSSERATDGKPVVFFIQGGQASSASSPINDPSPWYMGEVDPLNLRGGNSFRYGVRIDRSKTVEKVQIQSVTIFYQS